MKYDLAKTELREKLLPMEFSQCISIAIVRLIKFKNSFINLSAISID